MMIPFGWCRWDDDAVARPGGSKAVGAADRRLQLNTLLSIIVSVLQA
jgi:hypothetical protein